MTPPPEEDDDAYVDPTLVAPIPVMGAKKLSQIELSELQLLHRMIYHPSVMARVVAANDFQFVHRRYQDLFEVMINMPQLQILKTRKLRLKKDQFKKKWQRIKLRVPHWFP